MHEVFTVRYNGIDWFMTMELCFCFMSDFVRTLLTSHSLTFLF